MSKENDDFKSIKYDKLHQVIKLLKFIVTLDDLEIIKATIEAITEILEEENNQSS